MASLASPVVLLSLCVAVGQRPIGTVPLLRTTTPYVFRVSPSSVAGGGDAMPWREQGEGGRYLPAGPPSSMTTSLVLVHYGHRPNKPVLEHGAEPPLDVPRQTSAVLAASDSKYLDVGTRGRRQRGKYSTVQYNKYRVPGTADVRCNSELRWRLVDRWVPPASSFETPRQQVKPDPANGVNSLQYRLGAREEA